MGEWFFEFYTKEANYLLGIQWKLYNVKSLKCLFSESFYICFDNRIKIKFCC